MMRMLGIDMRVKCNTKDVIANLTKNREEHKRLVAEARAGYLDSARKELRTRLSQLDGDKVVNLKFKLEPPLDYTSVYDTALGMLSQHTENCIELDADTYRHLVQDEWEWTKTFVARNSLYSSETIAFGTSKNLEVE